MIMDNDFYLYETTIEDSIDFLYKIAKEDKSEKYIWNISDNSLVWSSVEHFTKYIYKDFGTCYLYSAYYKSSRLGFFGMLNLNKYSHNANIIVWLDKAIRGKGYINKWVPLFLFEAKNKGIERWYAKIKHKNRRSFNAALKFGFIESPIPPHLTKINKHESRIHCVTRSISFTNCERQSNT